MKILFCQLRNHGDIIRTFPLLDAIKQVHPDWEIGFTCYPEMLEVCRLSPAIDKVFPQPKLNTASDSEGGTRLLDCRILSDCVSDIKRTMFDVYVDLHGVFQSALIGILCNIPIRLGRSKETAKDGAHLFYTTLCRIHEREINRMERHFQIFATLFREIHPSPPHPVLGKKVILFPGSSKNGILKRWDIKKYADVAHQLSCSHQVLIVLGPNEHELESHLPPSPAYKIVHSSDWQEVSALFSDCKLVIGNDIAYTHMAIWKNIPTIMICGPLSAQINGVWSYGTGETVRGSADCLCSNPWTGICNHRHQCITTVDVSQVMEAANKYL